jgi:hypothetical protein
LNVLKHSRDFGQGSAPEDIVSGVISKIEAEAPIRTHPLVDEVLKVFKGSKITEV